MTPTPEALAEAERPDWNRVYRDCVKPANIDQANDLVLITRHTAELAANAMKRDQVEEAYHNGMYAKQELIAAALTRREPPPGWVMVPVEPTGWMIEAGRTTEASRSASNSALWNVGSVWTAMLAAAPTPPQEKP